jgi:small conductance mechanosensitive channel
MQTLPNALNQFLRPESLQAMLVAATRVTVILIVATVVSRIISTVVPRIRARLYEVVRDGSAVLAAEMEKRARTVSMLIRRTLTTIVWAIAFVMILREAGFDIAPMLAGAGVLGLAIGFGAQNLVRDVISGLFLLVENQIRVGDVAIVNGTGGAVEEVNLRTTILRGLDGTVHIFPNGTITTLSNMTHTFSYYLLDTGVAYKEDTDAVIEVLKSVAAELAAEPDYAEAILEPLEVLGVDSFADSAVIIKSRIKTKPIEQWRVGRELNRRIKQAFDREGIEIPFPQRTLHMMAPPQESISKDQLKEAIREVLEEQGVSGK